MKKIFTYLFFTLIVNSVFSQAYKPVVVEGRQWNYIYAPVYILEETDYSTYEMRISFDTLINGHEYKKLLYRHNKTLKDWHLYAYLREDIEKQRVYLLDMEDLEIVLFDFKAEVGDIIESPMGDGTSICNEVLSTDIIYIDGESHKKITIFTSCPGAPVLGSGERTWIEGIGGLDGIPESSMPYIGYYTSLLCLSEDGDWIFKNEKKPPYIEDEELQCSYWRPMILSVENAKKEKDVKIWFSSENKTIEIQVEESYSYDFELYDSMGRIKVSKKNNLGNSSHDMNFIPDGIYIVKIIEKSGSVRSQKIIK